MYGGFGGLGVGDADVATTKARGSDAMEALSIQRVSSGANVRFL